MLRAQIDSSPWLVGRNVSVAHLAIVVCIDPAGMMCSPVRAADLVCCPVVRPAGALAYADGASIASSDPQHVRARWQFCYTARCWLHAAAACAAWRNLHVAMRNSRHHLPPGRCCIVHWGPHPAAAVA